MFKLAKRLENNGLLKLPLSYISKLNVFDMQSKIKQRNRAVLRPDSKKYDYLREEMTFRMADRIFDIKRKFDVAVDFGCGRCYLRPHLTLENVGMIFECDSSEKMLNDAVDGGEVQHSRLLVNEERFPFRKNTLDLVISILSLHWINDLPGVMKQINAALKPDGCFLGVMFGGDTLFQLRSALYLADNERLGGFGPHIAPFVDNRDLGNLLNNAGFNLLTIDMDEISIHYPSVFELMDDLRGMGNSNCTWSRVNHLSRDVMFAAAAIYDEMYAIKPSESDKVPNECKNMEKIIPATFQFLHFIAWKPHPSQQVPAKRGSATVSFKDLGKVTNPSQSKP